MAEDLVEFLTENEKLTNSNQNLARNNELLKSQILEAEERMAPLLTESQILNDRHDQEKAELEEHQ